MLHFGMQENTIGLLRGAAGYICWRSREKLWNAYGCDCIFRGLNFIEVQ